MATDQDQLLIQLTRKRSEALRNALETCSWEVSDLVELIRTRRQEFRIDHVDPTAALRGSLGKTQMLPIGLCAEIAIYLGKKPVELYCEFLHAREKSTLEQTVIMLAPAIQDKKPDEQEGNAEGANRDTETKKLEPPEPEKNEGDDDAEKDDNETQEGEQTVTRTLEELRQQALNDAIEAADTTVAKLTRSILRTGETYGNLYATIGACTRGNRLLDGDLIERIATALGIPVLQLKVREHTDSDGKAIAQRPPSNGQTPAPSASDNGKSPTSRTSRGAPRRASTSQNGSTVALAMNLEIPRETLLRILDAQEAPAQVELDGREFVITFRCPAKKILLEALEDE